MSARSETASEDNISWETYMAGRGRSLPLRALRRASTVIFRPIHEYAKKPTKATRDAVGIDVYIPHNAAEENDDIEILPHCVRILDTGIQVLVPTGYYAQLMTRSSTARRGILVIGGVIDPDYRGTIKVILLNTSDEPQYVNPYAAVAQVIVFSVGGPPMSPRIRWQPYHARLEGITVLLENGRGEHVSVDF